MEKKNTILLTIVAIATLLVTVIGATFAYFASNVNTDAKVGVNVNTSNKQASFIATSNGSLDINVESYMMQQADAGDGSTTTSNNENIAKNLTTSATLNVSLTGTDDEKNTTCTYDLIYTWTGSDTNFSNPGSSNNGIYPSKYYVRTNNSNSTGFKELTIEVDATGAYVGDNSDERGFSAVILKEKNIDELAPQTTNNQDNKILVLKAGETITSQSTTQASHVDYQITVRFYNLGSQQDNLMNKKFSGTVSVANVKC